MESRLKEVEVMKAEKGKRLAALEAIVGPKKARGSAGIH